MIKGLLVLFVASIFVASASGEEGPSKLGPIGLGPLKLGIDRLLTPPYLDLLKNKRLGLLVHHASRDQKGRHLVDLLAAQIGPQVKMIFAPEHGYRSIGDALLPDSVDSQTGLPVYSLYGPRQAPTAEMLNQIDTVVIDLQDVGIRFYTYPATMVYVMKACKAAGKNVIVLDRPNPLGGQTVEGAVLEKGLVSGKLTTLAAIPTRHGMTLGELARFYNDVLKIGTDLTVVPMTGWNRSFLWEDTGLNWVPSSPALLSQNQATLYGAFGALETLNIAVGRGINNALAFHTYGAPWISTTESQTLVSNLKSLNLKGLSFSEITWTPDRGPFQKKACHGFRVDVANSHQIESFLSLIEVMSTMKRLLGTRLDTKNAVSSLGARWLLDGIDGGASPQSLISRAQAEYVEFLNERTLALIY